MGTCARNICVSSWLITEINYFELLQFIAIIYITNKCNQYVICLSFIHFVRLFVRDIQTAVSTPTENWTHVYMNLFTRNSPYCHLIKCLLFLLKHLVYIYIIYIYIYNICNYVQQNKRSAKPLRKYETKQ